MAEECREQLWRHTDVYVQFDEFPGAHNMSFTEFKYKFIDLLRERPTLKHMVGYDGHHIEFGYLVNTPSVDKDILEGLSPQAIRYNAAVVSRRCTALLDSMLTAYYTEKFSKQNSAILEMLRGETKVHSLETSVGNIDETKLAAMLPLFDVVPRLRDVLNIIIVNEELERPLCADSPLKILLVMADEEDTDLAANAVIAAVTETIKTYKELFAWNGGNLIRLYACTASELLYSPTHGQPENAQEYALGVEFDLDLVSVLKSGYSVYDYDNIFYTQALDEARSAL